MNTLDFCRLDAEEVLHLLAVNQDLGLTDEQVRTQIEKYGLNVIEEHEIQWWQVLLRQFRSSFVYLLMAASVVAFILGQTMDAILIAFFILINSVLGFAQEYRSEMTVQSLRRLTAGRARVRRNGVERTITNDELVRGDIVLLETGDIVPADVRILKAHNFLVDESIMTGESIQVSKTSAPISEVINQPYQAKNIVFKGTSVLDGTAEGIVVTTGENTEFGQISHMISQTSKESAFQVNINRISRFVMWLVLATMSILLLIHFLISRDGAISFVDLLIFSIALTVGVIPEALPLVTTFSLSTSARNLARKSVVVKRLTSVEDLGSIQVLCTDKTGTITENKLTIADIYKMDQTANPVFSASLAVSNILEQQSLPNNAFDLSLIANLNEAEKAELRTYELVNEIPFDPNRRRNSVLVSRNGRRLLVIRGSPEEMIGLDKGLTNQKETEALEWIALQGKQGRRTLAISVEEDFPADDYDERAEANHIHVCGIISFVDALKSTTKKVVDEAAYLGVRLVVLTGDDPVVAGAVAKEAGIISDPEAVMTGADFDRLTDSEKENAVKNMRVFARVSPKQKYEILGLLMKKYQTGFLGEGINDAPALKLAHVSLVVESAADIARESADIILLKHDLGVIIEGIFEGRRTFHNTVNYIRATLLSNFGNFYAVAFASLLIPYLPMLPVQILLVNLLSDFPMFSIATDNVNRKDLQNPKNYDTKDIILVASVLGIVSTFFDFIIFSVFRRFEPGVLQTSWFIGSISTELVLMFSIRTNRIFFRAGVPPSKTIIALSTLALLIAVSLPFTSFGQRIFHFIRPSPHHLMILLFITIGYFMTTELVKILYYRTIGAR